MQQEVAGEVLEVFLHRVVDHHEILEVVRRDGPRAFREADRGPLHRGAARVEVGGDVESARDEGADEIVEPTHGVCVEVRPARVGGKGENLVLMVEPHGVVAAADNLVCEPVCLGLANVACRRIGYLRSDEALRHARHVLELEVATSHNDLAVTAGWGVHPAHGRHVQGASRKNVFVRLQRNPPLARMYLVAGNVRHLRHSREEQPHGNAPRGLRREYPASFGFDVYPHDEGPRRLPAVILHAHLYVALELNAHRLGSAGIDKRHGARIRHRRKRRVCRRGLRPDDGRRPPVEHDLAPCEGIGGKLENNAYLANVGNGGGGSEIPRDVCGHSAIGGNGLHRKGAIEKHGNADCEHPRPRLIGKIAALGIDARPWRVVEDCLRIHGKTVWLPGKPKPSSDIRPYPLPSVVRALPSHDAIERRAPYRREGGAGLDFQHAAALDLLDGHVTRQNPQDGPRSDGHGAVGWQRGRFGADTHHPRHGCDLRCRKRGREYADVVNLAVALERICHAGGGTQPAGAENDILGVEPHGDVGGAGQHRVAVERQLLRRGVIHDRQLHPVGGGDVRGGDHRGKIVCDLADQRQNPFALPAKPHCARVGAVANHEERAGVLQRANAGGDGERPVRRQRGGQRSARHGPVGGCPFALNASCDPAVWLGMDYGIHVGRHVPVKGPQAGRFRDRRVVRRDFKDSGGHLQRLELQNSRHRQLVS